MGFLPILTKNHNHPTSHLFLITQVIGSEALVKVDPLEQSGLTANSRTREGWGESGGTLSSVSSGRQPRDLPHSQGCSDLPPKDVHN